MLPLFQIISWVLQIYLLILELIIVSPDLIPYLEEIIRDLSQMFFLVLEILIIVLVYLLPYLEEIARYLSC